MGRFIRESVLSLVTLSVIFATTFVFHLTQSFYMNSAKGEDFFKQGRYMTSLAYLIPAAQAKSQNSETLEYLAMTYDKLGRKEEALKSLQRLAEIDSKNLKTKSRLADAYYGLGDFAKAEELYRTLLLSEDKPVIKRRLAEVSAWQEKYEQAEVLLIQLCKDYPRDYKSRELLADIYTWNKKYNQAVELYKQVVSLDSGNKDVILKLADDFRYTGKDKEAVVLYKQYIENAK